jgi:hypothetical protein
VAVAAWELPTTIAAVLIAIGVIGKTIHWVYVWAKRVDTSLEYVRQELSFNGGSSTRDAVKRIECRLAAIEANQGNVASDLVQFRRHSTAAARAVGDDVSTLLDHDRERDQPGLRYDTEETAS